MKPTKKPGGNPGQLGGPPGAHKDLKKFNKETSKPAFPDASDKSRGKGGKKK